MAQQDQLGKHATSIRTENGFTIVRYHDTDVVKFNQDKIILDSGGWLTATTKTRMNQASNQFDLGYAVSQMNWDWYVSWNVTGGETFNFYDGIELKR